MRSASSAFSWTGGDVFGAIKDGIAKVAKFVVSTVTNGVKFSLHIVIDNVKYGWNALVEYGSTFVQKTFDLVQEVFDKVKVSFEHLFGWLAYIFNWQDILKTQQVLSYTIDQTFELIEEAIEDFKKMVDANISNLETWISQNFSQVISSFSGANSLGQYQTANNTPNPQAAALTSTNFLFTGVLNNANSMQLAGGGPVGARLTDDATQKLDALMQKITVEVGSLQSTTAFTNAITYFKQMGGSTDQAFQMLISGLLSVIEGLALAALEGAKAVFDLLCDAAKHIVHGVREAIEAEWNIPFVSELYAYITNGGTFTGLNLMSLLLAIPATAFYKLVYKAAPVPNAGGCHDVRAELHRRQHSQRMGHWTNGAQGDRDGAERLGHDDRHLDQVLRRDLQRQHVLLRHHGCGRGRAADSRLNPSDRVRLGDVDL